MWRSWTHLIHIFYFALSLKTDIHMWNFVRMLDMIWNHDWLTCVWILNLLHPININISAAVRNWVKIQQINFPGNIWKLMVNNHILKCHPTAARRCSKMIPFSCRNFEKIGYFCAKTPLYRDIIYFISPENLSLCGNRLKFHR